MFRFLSDNAHFLAAGFLLMLTSSYGQTFFISIFSAHIMEEFSLSDGQWGRIYTIGTSLSAAVMLWAGTLADKFRVRNLAWAVLPGLGLACIAMALNPWASTLILVVFFLRIFGQGMTFQLAAVAMARWFSSRRGLALSISTLGFDLGQALFPAVFASLLTVFDWRVLWAFSAALVLITFPAILWLLKKERTPQQLVKQSSSTGMKGMHWTRRQVLSTAFFWMLVPTLLGPPAWGTALFFQQVHIASIKGWPLVEYLAIIPLLTGFSVIATLISGYLIDRFGSGKLMQVFLLPWIIGFLLLAQAETLLGASIAFVFFGIAAGLQATVITAFWAQFFGTAHIGSIKATSTSIMVFGSAIGPGVTGTMIDYGYNFPSQMPIIAVYFAIANLLAIIAVTRAQRDLPATSQIDIESA